jgi:hypothetical protein
LIISTVTEDHPALRDFVVVGGSAGFVFQAILGAWAFLLPSTRPPIPERRRRELVAMELAGRLQVIVYNTGLILVLLGLRFDLETALAGTVLAWTAAAWALIKSWSFPLLARLPLVKAWGESWWAPPDT